MRLLAVATFMVLLGAGCTGQVPADLSSMGAETQKNIDQLNETVDEIQKISEDLKVLKQDVDALFNKEEEQPAESTTVPPSEDPPQP